MKAVILAGGKGSRLKPYTISLPKPLMPVGNHPILEIVIQQLKRAGITNIIIAVGYLESLIRAFFKNGTEFGANITYSSERKPMGTAGPLSLVAQQLDDTFILMNGDVLSDMDFNALINFHKSNGAYATVAVVKRHVDVDFGVIEMDLANQFRKWREKPKLSYLVSTGIYVFEPQVLDSIPEDFFNLPDLIIKLHETDKGVRCYLHEGYWLDIGRFEDYQEACLAVDEKKLDFGIE